MHGSQIRDNKGIMNLKASCVEVTYTMPCYKDCLDSATLDRISHACWVYIKYYPSANDLNFIFSVQDALSHRVIEKRRRDRMNSCLGKL